MNDIKALIEKYKNIRDKMGINLLDMIIDDLSKLVTEPEYKVVTQGDKKFVSIGMGDENEHLYTKYNINEIEIYRLNYYGENYNRGWKGCVKTVEYYVTEEFYKNNIEKFQKKKPEYTVIQKGDKKFVSIGKGEGNIYLCEKYNIDNNKIYRLDYYGDVYDAGWAGGLSGVEFYVEEDYYLENIDKFQKG